MIVLGGGPAGCAAALSLYGRGIENVLIVERSDYSTPRVGESLPPETISLLNALGIGEEFEREGHEKCTGSVSSWGSDEPGYNDFLFNPGGPGWHLDRIAFDRFMARMAEQKGLELRRSNTFVEAGENPDGSHRLFFQDREGKSWSASTPFVVDATGNRSLFAKSKGSQTYLYDKIYFIYGFFELDPDSSFGKMTLLEATEHGWWYGARLPENRLVVAFGCGIEQIRNLKLNQWENWLNHLTETKHLSQNLSGAKFDPGSLITTMAPSFCLDRVYGEDWIAVGDAASGYDPISSQGVYKAIHSAIAGTEALCDYMENGDVNRLKSFQELVQDRFETFIKNRNYFYSMETRWPDSAFWKDRRGASLGENG